MGVSAFRDHVVVITGASSGIGKALALQLSGEGAHLALAARNAERLEQLAETCREGGAGAIAVPTDVSDEAQCRALMERAYATYGRVDMLINNAGIAVGSLLGDLPDLHLFEQVMAVNFYGAVYCTYYALPYLKQAHGRLVNISSLGGRLAIPGNTPYVASKFALEGFTESLRMEVGREVSVTVVCPYWVVTEFHERFMNKDGTAKGPSGRAIYTDRTMSAEQCARITLDAARRRRREVVMGPGRLGQWAKLLAPAYLDELVVRWFFRPAVRRMTQGEQRRGAGRSRQRGGKRGHNG